MVVGDNWFLYPMFKLNKLFTKYLRCEKIYFQKDKIDQGEKFNFTVRDFKVLLLRKFFCWRAINFQQKSLKITSKVVDLFWLTYLVETGFFCCKNVCTSYWMKKISRQFTLSIS